MSNNLFLSLFFSVLFQVTCCTIHSCISNEKNSSFSFIHSLLPSPCVMANRVEVLNWSQLSCQRNLVYFLLYRQNFHGIKILLTFYAFSCLRAEYGSYKEIRTEWGKSLSYLCTHSHQRGKLPREKCSSSLKLCKIILLKVTSITFTFPPQVSLLV